VVDTDFGDNQRSKRLADVAIGNFKWINH
jgi:hypothetical protein